jgi:hypothetical protein
VPAFVRGLAVVSIGASAPLLGVFGLAFSYSNTYALTSAVRTLKPDGNHFTIKVYSFSNPMSLTAFAPMSVIPNGVCLFFNFN